MKYVNEWIEGMAVTWRNKDMSRPLSQEQVEYFSDLAVQTPTKQSNRYFDVYAITNQETIKKIYLASDVPTSDADELNFQPRNPQVMSPLLLLWIQCDESFSRLAEDRYLNNMNDGGGDDLFVDRHQAVGISAGVVAYEANRLGFQTGYCRCLDGPRIINDLENDHNLKFGSDPDVLLSLGIGHGLVKDNPRWHGVLNFQMLSHDRADSEIIYIK